jgi:hypothetical protein
MSRTISLTLLLSCLALMGLCFALAPEFFTEGGWIQHSIIHAGTVVSAIYGFVAAQNLIRN